MRKHKIIAFVLALLVSIALWVYAVTVVNPDDTVYIRDVRVRITGASDLPNRGLILSGGENQTVNIEIAGRRSDLKELNSSSVEATADVSNIIEAGEYEITWKIGLPSTVGSGDVNIVSASSTRVKVTVSNYMERTDIPIKVEYVGKLPENYQRHDPDFEPETITVSGPAEDVVKIDRAVITVDQDGATDAIIEDMEYRLVDKNGEELELSDYVKIADATVHVRIDVNYYKRVNIAVNLIPGGGVTRNDVDLTIEPQTILLEGSEAALKDLEEIFIKDIDLAEIMESQSIDVDLILPAGVNNSADEKKVTVTITFKSTVQKKTFTIRCSDFIRENDVEDLDFNQTSISVTVRGTKDALQAIQKEDIKVYADMATYNTDNNKVTLRIELPEGTTAAVINAPSEVWVSRTAE